jgi:hypothetical protein
MQNSAAAHTGCGSSDLKPADAASNRPSEIQLTINSTSVMKISTLFGLALVAGLAIGSASEVRATTISWDLTYEFSGAQAPASATQPWVRVVIEDNGANQVRLTLTAPNLTGSENISDLLFNFNPSKIGLINLLSISPSGSTFDTSTINQGDNIKNADGDGLFDVWVAFTPGGVTSSVFNQGDQLVLDMQGTGILTISAADFAFTSHPQGGKGPFPVAAHIQNTTGAGTGGSGWIAPVPEPSTVIGGLMLLLPLGLGVYRGLRERC